MRTINEIVVHCAATRPELFSHMSADQKMAEIRKWHLARNFRREGYHGLIDRDGTRALGRPYAEQGAHVSGRNRNTIGLCLWGGYGGGKHDDFLDNFTPEQDRELRKWIAELQDEFGPGLHLSGHHEYANKACPTFDVRPWYAGGSPTVIVPPIEPPPAVLPDEDMGGSGSTSPEQVMRWRLAEIRDIAIEALENPRPRS